MILMHILSRIGFIEYSLKCEDTKRKEHDRIVHNCNICEYRLQFKLGISGHVKVAHVLFFSVN